jgi:all-trans-8'-apo-beta-carotenal 15,15'-oxygenase
MSVVIPPARQSLGASITNVPREHGFEPLRIEGEVPGDLRGVLVRNGPALFENFGVTYKHWFDGDGAITAFRFTDRGVEGAVRVTETPELKEERAAQKMLYSSGFTRGPIWYKRLFGAGKNPTNINALYWQNRLFAMPEMGVPIELDPETLQTKQAYKLGGALKQTANAHFRVDPRSKMTYLSGLSMGMNTSLEVYELPPSGAPRCLTSVSLRGLRVMVHDFAISENYLIFLIHPLGVKLLPIMLGTQAAADLIRWQPELGSEVILVRRDNGEVTRFTTRAFFHFHYSNAFERDGLIFADLCPYETYQASDAFWLSNLRSGKGFVDVGVAYLERAVINPREKTFTRSVLFKESSDFPSTSPAVQGAAYRYVYPLVTREHHDFIAKVDVESRQAEYAQIERAIIPGEVSFVSKPNATTEDDGWLLSMVYHLEKKQSGVIVLDAKDLSRGPIASAWFDHHVPIPLHGTWIAG